MRHFNVKRIALSAATGIVALLFCPQPASAVTNHYPREEVFQLTA